ncbi:MAG: hypothetical protein K0Q69_663 [Devosia sp.]|jgi:hypothetical protein|nr:hypothetical protein [Devosia sp.]
MDGDFGGGVPAAKPGWWWKKERLRRKRDSQGTKFKLAEIKAHLRQHHPHCPEWIRHELYRLIRGRHWPGPLGQAVGITMENFVRHEMTDYEMLFNLHGMTSEEARKLVRPEVSDIIASWGPDNPPPTERVMIVLRGRPQGDEESVGE